MGVSRGNACLHQFADIVQTSIRVTRNIPEQHCIELKQLRVRNSFKWASWFGVASAKRHKACIGVRMLCRASESGCDTTNIFGLSQDCNITMDCVNININKDTITSQQCSNFTAI